VIDGFDNHVETAYTGWPDRLYLVAPVGAVIYKSKPGPFGFHPDDLAAALKRTLGTL
jgi:type I thyroxine 5'-deiodinase